MVRKNVGTALLILVFAGSIALAQMNSNNMMGQMNGQMGGMMNGNMDGCMDMGNGMMMQQMDALIDANLSNRQIRKIMDVHHSMMKEQVPLLRRLNEIESNQQPLSSGQMATMNDQKADPEIEEIQSNLAAIRGKAQTKAWSLLNEEQQTSISRQTLDSMFSNANCPMHGSGMDSEMMQKCMSMMHSQGMQMDNMHGNGMGSSMMMDQDGQGSHHSN